MTAQAKPLTELERYRFDVEGYLVVPALLEPDEAARLNDAVDACADRIVDDPNESIAGSKTLSGTRKRRRLGSLLTLPRPWCEPFRDLIAHPRIRPYLNELLGRGWRLDHHPSAFIADKGAEGLIMHGVGRNQFHSGAYYEYANGAMRCGLLALEFALSDTAEGDGGFACIPGSHKANFALPVELHRCEAARDMVRNVPHKAGDLLIFSEATAHGTLPWTAEHQRRALLYRYVPRALSYARDVFHEHVPAAWLDELDEVRRSVIAPPQMHHRSVIADDGSLEHPLLEL